MKHLRKFDSVSEMNAAIASSEINILGLAYNNGTPVMKNKSNSSPVPPTPSHDYVEIGGVKWATMNVGANSVTDLGLYYRWGETQGYTKAYLETETTPDYRYMDENYNYTKYNDTDEKTVLDLSDDAVNAAWGGNWRMPTKSEFAALAEYTDSEHVTNYQGSGVEGWLLTDKTDSSKVLFFPCLDVFEVEAPNTTSELYWSNDATTMFGLGHAFGLICTQQMFNWDDYDWNYDRTYFNVVRGVLDD